MGPGVVPSTYEVLSDKTAADQDGDEDDRNVTHYPFFDTRNDNSFLEGRRLGTGKPTMKVPEDDCSWNSDLVGAGE